jgi:thioredoxin 1
MLIIKRFTASWCKPCSILTPIFSELQGEIPGVSFQTIDVDNNRDLALENNVSSVPTVILEKDGQQVYRFSGVLPKSVIAGIIRQHL